ncbi:RCC1 domain-containing protein 1-like [Amblyomma americanum]
MSYCYYGFDKFECFCFVPGKCFRSCPEAPSPLRSVHVGWASAILVTEAGAAELRGWGGPRRLAAAGVSQAALGPRGHWLLLLEAGGAWLGRPGAPRRWLLDERLCDAAVGSSRALLLQQQQTGGGGGGCVLELRLDGLAVARPVARAVRQVSCGHGHQLALTADGGALSWGDGGRGQLGHGGVSTEEAPRPIEALAGLQLTAVAAGGWHSAALAHGGDLYLWGWNRDGQLGGSPCELPLAANPRLLPLEDVVSVALGSRHTVALLGDGSAWAWGSNDYGQVGPHETGPSWRAVRLAEGRAVGVSCSPWATLVQLDSPRDPF